MKRELLLSAALIVAPVAVAQAQMGAPGTFNNGFTNISPGVGASVPNQGAFVNPFAAPVDAATGLAMPPVTGVPPFAGFTGAFDPNLLNQGAIASSGQGFVTPGFTGFVPGFVGGGYFPGAYNLTPNGSLGVPPPRMPGGRVPILGLNVPASAIPRAPRARVTQLSPTAGERLVDTPNGVVPGAAVGGGYGTNGANTAVARANTAPRDFATVKQVENLMREDRPLHEGRVVSVGATGAEVSFSMNERTRTERFPVDEVFFFRANGDLVTMAQHPELVRVGSRVLIAEPRTTTPGFAVAGSRQMYARNGVTATNASYKVTRRRSATHAKKKAVKRHTAKRKARARRSYTY